MMMSLLGSNDNDDIILRAPLQVNGGVYQEVGGRRHGDAVVEQLPCVVVHGSTAFHRLTHTNTDTHTINAHVFACGQSLSPSPEQ